MDHGARRMAWVKVGYSLEDGENIGKGQPGGAELGWIHRARQSGSTRRVQ